MPDGIKILLWISLRLQQLVEVGKAAAEEASRPEPWCYIMLLYPLRKAARISNSNSDRPA
ncbi:hypothetical protein MVEN_00061800 [Mycena venus]|uniref:Uncharacterized protein n=1 Tax=Mycena venus TaxID=2733690 RepID=A0A8H6ZA90_9AGAR|nr:hypothetical protein MVEN_00061800 [Mycena venus]